MRYIAVARVSTSAQTENTSLGNQLQVIDAYASEQLWTKVGEYTDTDSRTTYAEREGLQAALRDVKAKKADLVLFYDISRIGVDVSIRAFINDLYAVGGKLGLATERRIFRTQDDAMVDTILTGAVSTYEYQTILRRTNQGKKRAIQLGGVLGKPPFGYRSETVVVQGSKIKRPVVDEVEAAIVHEVMDSLIAGMGRYEISSFLQKKYGHVIKRDYGYAFISTLVKHLPKYRGETEIRPWKVGGEILEMRVDFPRIISDEKYLAATKAVEFAASVNNPRHRKKRTTPFLRVAVCSCGNRIGNGGTNFGQTSLICGTYSSYHYKKTQGKLKGDETYCPYHLNHVAVMEEMKKYLRDVYPVQSMAQVNRLVEYTSARYEERSREAEMLRAEEMNLKDSLLKMDPAQLNLVAGVFNEKLAEVKAKLDKAEASVNRIETVLMRMRNYNETLKADDRVKTGEEIIRLMEEDNWKEVNSRLYDLGIQVEVNSSKDWIEDKSARVPFRISILAGAVAERLSMTEEGPGTRFEVKQGYS